MPLGRFLDAFPSAIFVSAHLLFLAVGVWALTRQRWSGAPVWRGAFVLYAVSQAVFLAFFGGVLTMKMAVLVEQTLMVILIAAIARRGRPTPAA